MYVCGLRVNSEEKAHPQMPVNKVFALFRAHRLHDLLMKRSLSTGVRSYTSFQVEARFISYILGWSPGALTNITFVEWTPKHRQWLSDVRQQAIE